MSTTAANHVTLEEVQSRHGGYWRYSFLDFHYLYNHYFPPPAMREALQREFPRLIDFYPSAQHALANIVAAWNDAPYFRPEHLVIGNGSSELIKILLGIIGRVTVPLPTFNEFMKLPGDRMHAVWLDEQNGFTLDPKAIRDEALQAGSDAVVIVNPNNPVGNAIAPPSLLPLLRSGLLVIVDEAFIDWAGPGMSCEPFIAEHQNLIVVKSLTKVAGTAGIRLAYLLTSNAEVRQQVIDRLPIWNVNAIAERFAELFPTYRGDFEQSIARTITDREYLLWRLQEISWLTPLASRANFILCGTTTSARRIVEMLFEQNQILVKDGLNQLHPNHDHYLRFGVRPKGDVDRLIVGLRALMMADDGSSATAVARGVM